MRELVSISKLMIVGRAWLGFRKRLKEGDTVVLDENAFKAEHLRFKDKENLNNVSGWSFEYVAYIMERH